MTSTRGRVLIEFTKATDTRKEGERLYVDPMSAKSFVEDLKVAKKLTDKQAEAAAKDRAEAPEQLGTVGGVG